jgi:amino acid transporter
MMQLKPTLGPVQLAFYGIGIIVGAGVYSVIGTAAGIAQQGLWLSFLIGAIVALLTGFSYAEMTTSFPRAGAEYLYLKRALPKSDWAAFGVGLLILMGGAATASTVAVAFGGYLKSFVDVPIWLSAVTLLVACTAFNIWGLRESSWVNILFTTIEVSGLVLVVAAGATKGGLYEPLLTSPSPGGFPAAAIVFFVYLGFEGIANLTEEAREPSHDLPRAIFYSIGITTVLYVLVSLAVIALATPGELALSEAPLALAIQKTWPGATGTLSAIAIFATANTVLISLIASSRLAFSMGRDGEIPRSLERFCPHGTRRGSRQS